MPAKMDMAKDATKNMKNVLKSNPKSIKSPFKPVGGVSKTIKSPFKTA